MKGERIAIYLKGVGSLAKNVVTDRWEIIEKYVSEKEVLDVGCTELIGTTTDEDKKSRWMHYRISKVAKSVIGVDIGKEQVDILRSRGYNIIHGDAENIKLDRNFDVVFAGELIEHLSNPGKFLDNMQEHLRDNGALILTTPNRFSLLSFMPVLVRGNIPRYKKPIPGHVFYFDIGSLETLVNRHGFHVVESIYYLTFSRTYDQLRTRIITKIIACFRPELSRGIVVVLKKDVDWRKNV